MTLERDAMIRWVAAPGIDTAERDGMVAVQCPTRYRWNGEGGHGWLERTRRLGAL